MSVSLKGPVEYFEVSFKVIRCLRKGMLCKVRGVNAVLHNDLNLSEQRLRLQFLATIASAMIPPVLRDVSIVVRKGTQYLPRSHD
jgi:hypothetical protein